ncbi:DUF2786 domain-containing protein [Actinomadura sp. K4S16]|uniref:DUF2786 domain-containing protein n=1 Tax=Actinomadura sp. K4S16 TaxID=1316147 RepID=UPI0011EDAC6C|nr:DUF2786 domain-containing protein [Actinomadura sp. K4S16]
MTTEQNPKLAKIRALLAKAESTEFPEEAAELTAKAAELMAKYGIDQAMIPEADADADKITDRHIECWAPWAREKVRFLCALAVEMRCRAIWITNGGGKGWCLVHVYGYESDIERLELLYTSLLVQMSHALAAAEPRGKNKRTWQRSFLYGYITTVVARVWRAESRAADDAQKASSGKAELVLADRESMVNARFQQAHPDAKPYKARYSSVGIREGMEAGNRADIGQKRTDSGDRHALSGG